MTDHPITGSVTPTPAAALAAFAWVPAAARTIPLDALAGLVPRGRVPTVIPLRWPDREPHDAEDYTLDLTCYLQNAGGDTITGVVATVSSDLIELAASWVTTSATLWLGGAGMPGADSVMTVVINTAAGRSICRTVKLFTLAS